MSSSLAIGKLTPTKHDATSFVLPDTGLPSKSISKKKSMISSTFGSLKSHFGGSERRDPGDVVALDAIQSLLAISAKGKTPPPTYSKCPRTLQKTPRTPQKLLTTLKRPFATIRGTRSVSKEESTVREPGKGGQGPIQVVRQVKRRKSLGDIFGILNKKRSQPLFEVEPITSINKVQATANIGYTTKVKPIAISISNVQPATNTESMAGVQPTATIESTSDVKFIPVQPSTTQTPEISNQSSPKQKTSDTSLQIIATKGDDTVCGIPGKTFLGDEFTNCRGSQQEDSESSFRCPVEYFDMEFPFKKQLECRGWLCKKSSEEDGIWPSSDTYLQQLFKATGDASDQKDYNEFEVPWFNGLSPHEYLRAKHHQRLRVFNMCEDLQKSTKTNQYMDLTSPFRFATKISETDSPKRMVGPVDLPQRTNDMVKRLDFNDPAFDMPYDKLFSDDCEGEPTDELTDEEVTEILAEMDRKPDHSSSCSGPAVSDKCASCILRELQTKLSATQDTDEYANMMKRLEAEDDEFLRELAEDLQNGNGKGWASDDDSVYEYAHLTPCEAFMAEIQASYQERAFKLRKESPEELIAKKLRQEAADKRHESGYEDEEHARRSRALMMTEREEFIREAELEEDDPEWKDILTIRRVAEKIWDETPTLASSGLGTSKNTGQLHPVAGRSCNDNDESPTANNRSRPIKQGAGWSLYANGAYVEHEESVGSGPIKVSFPRTSAHGSFMRAYGSRHEAILGIHATTRHDGEVYSDYCVYNPISNAVYLRLEDGTSIEHLTAEVDSKGQQLLWLPMGSDRQHVVDQNCEASQKSGTQSRSSSGCEKTSLATLEAFPELLESAPAGDLIKYHVSPPSDASPAGSVDSVTSPSLRGLPFNSGDDSSEEQEGTATMPRQITRRISLQAFEPTARDGDLSSIRTNCSSSDEHNGKESPDSGDEEVVPGWQRILGQNIMTHRVYSADLTAVSSTTSGAASFQSP